MRRHHRDKWLFRVESEKLVHVKMSAYHQKRLVNLFAHAFECGKINFTQMKNIVRFMY